MKVLFLILIQFSFASSGIFVVTYQEKNLQLIEQIDSLNSLAGKTINSAKMEGENLARNALMLSTHISYANGIALSNRILGLSLMNHGDYVEALAHLEKSKEWYLQMNDTAGLAKSLSNIGYIYTTLGNIKESLGAISDLIALATPNKGLQISALINLAIAVGKYDKIEQAIKYELKALQLAKTNSTNSRDQTALLYGNLCYHYYLIDQLDKAESYGWKAINFENTSVNPNYVYNSMGDIKNKRGAFEEAIYFYQKGVKFSLGKKSQTKYLARSYLGIANVYIQKEKTDTVRRFLHLALKEASKGPYLDILEEVYGLLYRISRQQHQYHEALKYLELNKQFEDSIFTKESQQRLTMLEFDNEIRENKIRLKREKEKVLLLIQEQKISRLQSVVYLLVTTSIFIIMIIVFVHFRQKFKKNKEILKSKNSELVQFALYVVSKDILLNNLKNEISMVGNSLKGTAGHTHITRLQRGLVSSLNVDSSKKEFTQHLKKTCKDYFTTLEKRYPGLSKKDRLLSALVKIELSSKEIAMLTNISMAGVNVARSRLRKKMGLERNENLAEVLNKIS